jgi:hypothetical protein
VLLGDDQKLPDLEYKDDKERHGPEIGRKAAMCGFPA